jgi:hypothetical protein
MAVGTAAMNHQSFDISGMLRRMIASVDVMLDERNKLRKWT